jgi:predicted transcriptional regulator
VVEELAIELPAVGAPRRGYRGGRSLGVPDQRQYNQNMPESTVRDRIMRALEDLPPDVTFEEAIERLVFLAKIDAGIAELDAGKGVPHDEAKRRLGM